MIATNTFVLFFILHVYSSSFDTLFDEDSTTPIFSNVGVGMTTLGGSWAEYDFSTVYDRRYWIDIEHTRGDIDFSWVDNGLTYAKENNVLIGFRLMPFGDNNETNRVPDWLKGMIGEENGVIDNIGMWVPDHNNEVFLSETERLVQAFGSRYNSYPSSEWIYFVDIGSIGYWGEGHLTYLRGKPEEETFQPTAENEKRIADLYLDEFSNVQNVLALCGSKNMLEYGASRGSGFRCDCFGDYGDPEWNHMEDMYPDRIERFGNNWTISPVVWETCWTMDHWVEYSFDIELIFQKGLEWHGSSLTNKNEATPTQITSQFDQFMVNFGYRYFVEKFTVTITPTDNNIQFSSEWLNRGVSPAYLDLTLMYRVNEETEYTSNFNFRTLIEQETIEDEVEYESEEEIDSVEICLYYEPETGYKLPITLGVEQNMKENGCYDVCVKVECLPDDGDDLDDVVEDVANSLINFFFFLLM